MKDDLKHLDGDVVRGLWDYMTRRHNTQVVLKASASEMRLLSQFLGGLGIINPERFMTRYTTIIGRRVYTPFTVGVADNREGLWRQLVNCVHEHQHVVQQVRDGKYLFARRYVTSPVERAHYEAEAYRCNMEMHWWRFGATPDPYMLANKLRDYGCRQRDIDMAAHMLEASAVSIRQGAIVNQATLEALMWLARHAPDIFEGGLPL